MLGADVTLVGFGAGITLNHWLNVGLAGSWSISVIKNPFYQDHLQGLTNADLGGLELRYGYGGLLLQPMVLSRSVVHLSVPVIAGMGSAAYSYPATNNGSNGNNNRRVRTDGQGYFVLEPGLELEVSIIRSVRLGLGGSYIFTSDLDLPNTPSDALRNYTARLGLTLIMGGGRSEVRN